MGSVRFDVEVLDPRELVDIFGENALVPGECHHSDQNVDHADGFPAVIEIALERRRVVGDVAGEWNPSRTSVNGSAESLNGSEVKW